MCVTSVHCTSINKIFSAKGADFSGILYRGMRMKEREFRRPLHDRLYRHQQVRRTNKLRRENLREQKNKLTLLLVCFLLLIKYKLKTTLARLTGCGPSSWDTKAKPEGETTQEGYLPAGFSWHSQLPFSHTHQGRVPPTVCWTLPHKLAIKQVPYRHGHRPGSSGQFFS